MTRDEWWEITKILNFIVFSEEMYWTVIDNSAYVAIRNRGSEESEQVTAWVDEMEDLHG